MHLLNRHINSWLTTRCSVDSLLIIQSTAAMAPSTSTIDDAEYLDHLGRQRPAKFKTLAAEIGFLFSIMTSQMMAVHLFTTHFV